MSIISERLGTTTDADGNNPVAMVADLVFGADGDDLVWGPPRPAGPFTAIQRQFAYPWIGDFTDDERAFVAAALAQEGRALA